MPILTPSRALLIGFIVAPGLFILCAYLTHATRRHLLGALVGILLYAGIEFTWDRFAAIRGWWTYPAWSVNGQFPLVGYLLAGIVGGGAVGLVGWRIIRRWRWKGYAFFLLYWAGYAIVHDYWGSHLFASSQLMVFGPGFVPIVADILWYIVGDAFPPLAVWIIGDRLFQRADG